MALTKDQIDIVNSMVREVNDAPRIYRASKYWQSLCERNMVQLSVHGPENFKRTINQNYFNWIPESADDRLLKRLLQFHKENAPSKPWVVDIEKVDLFQDLRLKNFFGEPTRVELYANFVGLLWYYTLKTDKHGILSSLSEPELGNPIRVMLEGKIISQDVANSVRERNVVVDHMGDAKVVAELGAGYGRVAYVFGLTTRCRFLVFDIPPALYLAQWYLGRLFPERKHMTFKHFERFEEIAEELETSDFAFFTPNQLALFPPKYVEAFITISSLQEMMPDQVENFLRLMRHTTRRIIYMKQWAKWRNPVDGFVMVKDAYRMADWQLILDRRDSVQERLFEAVYKAPS